MITPRTISDEINLCASAGSLLYCRNWKKSTKTPIYLKLLCAWEVHHSLNNILREKRDACATIAPFVDIVALPVQVILLVIVAYLLYRQTQTLGNI